MSLKTSWENSIIYFVLIDRFSSAGDSPKDFGKGEFNPADDNCFQGGDLRGVLKRLPYIKKMGFDVIWISPPIHNQWVNPGTPCRGYHGYWAYDFTKVDPHFGSLEDYRALVREAHRLGIRVIQDIVVNHVGNFFTVDAAAKWKSLGGTPGAPNDPVFRMNDPNVPEHRKAAIYNFTPNISDFNDREQTLKYNLCDLDDINLETPAAARRMAEVYRHWIDEVGIDGYRIDSVFYTPERFYENFLHAKDPKNPGMKRFAAKKGIRDFLVFGEIWNYDFGALNKYIEENGRARLDSAIDFPLNEALVQVFYKKKPTRDLLDCLRVPRKNRSLWVNFLDNHDIERMFGRADWKSIQQSMVALFTLPGIPCVYYGTEAGFKALRQNMFSDEYFTGKSKEARFLKKCIELRKKYPAFARGRLQPDKSSVQPGVLSYRLVSASRAPAQSLLVVFNTSTDGAFFQFSDTGKRYTSVLSSSAARLRKRAHAGYLKLEPFSFDVLREQSSRARAGLPAKSPRLSLDRKNPGPAGNACQGPLALRYALDPKQRVSRLQLLSDNSLGDTIEIPTDGTGRFELDTSVVGNGAHALSLLATLKSGQVRQSNEIPVTIENPFTLLARQPGSSSRTLAAPGDPSYRGQLKIEEVSCLSSGRDLRLIVRMGDVTSDWLPPNGFDHVYYSVFFDFPGQPGRKFLPKLRYRPEDFEFNLGFLLYGWGAIPFGAEGSTETDYGPPLDGRIAFTVDRERKTIAFDFSKHFFRSLKDLHGLKIHISTWDGYLGRFHPLVGKKEDWAFSCPDAIELEKVPRVFSEALLRT